MNSFFSFLNNKIDSIVQFFINTRARHYFMTLGSIFAILILIFTDPDMGIISQLPIGAGTLNIFVMLTKIFLFVTILHIARKALHDYHEASMKYLFGKAGETPLGAGLALIALAIINLAIAIVIMVITK